MIITILDKCRVEEKCQSCPFSKTSKCMEACPTDAIFLLNNKSFSCLTCGECARNCPNKAIKRNEFGGYYVDRRRCNGCGICANVCPIGIIKIAEKDGKKFPMGICSMCGICVEVCPYNARVSSYELLNTKREGLAERYLKVLENLMKVKLFRAEKLDKVVEKVERKSIKIDRDKCVGCLKCSYLCPRETIIPDSIDACTSCNLRGENCPKDAIKDGEVDYSKCILCLKCVKICPNDALKVENFKIIKVKEEQPKNEEKTKEAKDVLTMALSTLVEVENVIPIPLIKAQALVEEASKTIKKDKKQTLKYLDEAKHQLVIAEDLGYTSTSDTTYKMLKDEITKLESEIHKGHKTASIFSDLIQKLKEFKEKAISVIHK